MKRSILIRTAILALAFCLLPLSALAFNSYPIDVDAMKALEKTDTFDVIIAKKTVADGANSEWWQPDILTLTVDNNSDASLSQITVMIVCYDEEGLTTELQGQKGISTFTSYKEKRELNVLTFDVSAKAGATFQQNIPCAHSHFSGLRALIVQYVDSDGNAVTNPLYEAWQELALGSPTHILD